jgi:hypothetical protein
MEANPKASQAPPFDDDPWYQILGTVKGSYGDTVSVCTKSIQAGIEDCQDRLMKTS